MRASARSHVRFNSHRWWWWDNHHNDNNHNNNNNINTDSPLCLHGCRTAFHFVRRSGTSARQHWRLVSEIDHDFWEISVPGFWFPFLMCLGTPYLLFRMMMMMMGIRSSRMWNTKGYNVEEKPYIFSLTCSYTSAFLWFIVFFILIFFFKCTAKDNGRFQSWN